MTDFTEEQTVYLPDGREAVYVAQHGQNHFVRVVYDVPSNGYDEPPYSYSSEHITVSPEVFLQRPVERYDATIAEKKETIAALSREAADLRAQMQEIGRNKVAMEKAAEKYPCIQQALDFIEGRITHVVKWGGYGAAAIQTLKEALEDVDTWHGRRTVNGMKLLSLFGTDDKGRSVGWGLHQYRDGSGSGTITIWPARSEEEARAKVQELMDAAMTAFRSGDEKWHITNIAVDETLKANPWLETPDDWRTHKEAQEEKRRQKKIEELRAELAKLEQPA